MVFMQFKKFSRFYITNKIKHIFKTNALLFLIHNSNNKIFKQIKYIRKLSFKIYKIKTTLLFISQKNSINRLLVSAFIKNSNMIIIYCKTTNKTIIKNLLNFTHLLSIKFNNKFYFLSIVKKLYSLNYYQTKLLIYKFLNSSIKKLDRNNVN